MEVQLAVAGKRATVTGAAGFLGSHVIEGLMARGIQVRGVLRPTRRGGAMGGIDSLSVEQRKRIDVAYVDIKDQEGLSIALADADLVYHLAACANVSVSKARPIEVLDTNVIGTASVLQAARSANRIERIVIVSSSEVYGRGSSSVADEEQRLCPASPYAASKVATEAVATTFFRTFGTPIVIVRPFNVYGPRQSEESVISSLIVQALCSNTVRLREIRSRRDFTYVTDTADGIIRAGLTSAVAGEVFNLGTGKEVGIVDLIAEMERVLHRRLHVETSNGVEDLQQQAKPPRANIVKARRVLGWSPAVSLSEGLARTIEWFRSSLRARASSSQTGG